MKKIFVILAMLVWVLPASGGNDSPQRKYIEQFAPLAVEEMYRSGIPASITLAQGLLESGSGLSELAVKGNNHFGIKCHNNWTGGRMYYDDDRRGECFRKYPSPEQSYRDHSDFLRYRERYKFLFDYKITDYKSWAYGLKKAGYATDPSYPKKLIRIIEEYALYEYDTKSLSYAKPAFKQLTVTGKMTREEKKAAKDAAKALAELSGELPRSPGQIDEIDYIPEDQRQEFQFSLSREMYSKNGVPFVYSEEGDSYESLASSYNLFSREILRFNDLEQDTGLFPGTVVYLQKKKNQAAKGLDKHVIESGETMRDIAQKYGIRLSSLYKMNGMSEDYVPVEGDIIKLRK